MRLSLSLKTRPVHVLVFKYSMCIFKAKDESHINVLGVVLVSNRYVSLKKRAKGCVLLDDNRKLLVTICLFYEQEPIKISKFICSASVFGGYWPLLGLTIWS